MIFLFFATDIVHANNYFTGRTQPGTSQAKNGHYQYLNNDENMISFYFSLLLFLSKQQNSTRVVNGAISKRRSNCSYK